MASLVVVLGTVVVVADTDGTGDATLLSSCAVVEGASLTCTSSSVGFAQAAVTATVRRTEAKDTEIKRMAKAPLSSGGCPPQKRDARVLATRYQKTIKDQRRSGGKGQVYNSFATTIDDDLQ